MTPEQLAHKFHDTYERLALSFNYMTREASAVPWSEVPAANKRLMIAVCTEILQDLESLARAMIDEINEGVHNP